jgi:hypothetical protein
LIRLRVSENLTSIVKKSPKGIKTIERRAIRPTTISIVDTTLKIGSEIGSYSKKSPTGIKITVNRRKMPRSRKINTTTLKFANVRGISGGMVANANNMKAIPK